MTTVLGDADVARLLSAADAVRWMGEAVDAHHRGDRVAPQRVHAELGGGRLVFTTGRLRGRWFGYRSYDSFPGGPGSQVVVVHDEADGSVRALAVGSELQLSVEIPQGGGQERLLDVGSLGIGQATLVRMVARGLTS